ncbi:MAG: PBP1A family penicillin-binding protein [Nitrospinota bacterium]|nr:PBP1A family penicillin-binding protein [Nitrospinota bacterium]
MIRYLFKTLISFLFSVALLGVFTLWAVYFSVKEDLPQLPSELENINLSLPTEIYSADGHRIKVLGERHPVPFEEISLHFINAIVAVEDANFYEHNGLDHLALLRALYMNFKKKRITQGGSTITQQLSKNLFFSFDRNWVRKIKELLVALQMEVVFPKPKILQAYCNQIYFGNGAYGVEEASQVYFGKRAKDLTLLQAATLSGLPSSPNDINPFASYERSQKRARYVLDRMEAENFISPSEKEEALESSLELVLPKRETDPNLYFADFVIKELEKDYGKEFVFFGGLKIFTTLDTRLQQYAQKAADNHLKLLDENMALPEEMVEHLQAAAVAIENKTGAVRVMLGGRDYSFSQFNRAVSNNRLPGSSFKPFVYLTAMETLGYNPATLVTDEPVTFEIPGGTPWEPKNFNEEFLGDVILKKALERSVNIISAKMVRELTPEKVIQTARQFGISSALGQNLSLSLGTSAVSPLEMASAYSVIANLGMMNDPYFIQRIEDFQGNRLFERFFHGLQKFSQKSIYPLLDMMKGVVDQGTGRVVRRMGFKHPAAGKTGTSNDFKDSWFIGVTKDISAAVWVGYDSNQSMIQKSGKGLTGAGAAAPIWTFFMQKALDGKKEVQFPVPSGIKFVDVGIHTGLPETKTPGKTLRVALREEVELLPNDTEAESLLSSDVEADSDLESEPEPGSNPEAELENQPESDSENLSSRKDNEPASRLKASSDFPTGPVERNNSLQEAE